MFTMYNEVTSTPLTRYIKEQNRMVIGSDEYIVYTKKATH